MPRNDAKRTNTNTKRLPILVKITTKNKKRQRKNNKNKSLITTTQQKTNTPKRHRQQTQQQQQQQQPGLKSNKSDGTESWININLNSSGSGDTTTNDANNFAKASQAASRKHHKYPKLRVTTATPTSFKSITATTNSRTLQADRAQQHCGTVPPKLKGSNNSSLIKYFNNYNKHKKISFSSEEGEKAKEKVETNPHCFQSSETLLFKSNIKHKNNNSNNNSNSVVTNNSSNKEISEDTATATATVSSSLTTSSTSASASLSLPSTQHHHHHSRLSTLYPIVIETHISETKSSLPEDLNHTTATATTLTTANTLVSTSCCTTDIASSLSKTSVAAAAAAASTKHSTLSLNFACCSNETAPAIATTATATTTETSAIFTSATTPAAATAAAVDTLLEHQKHQQQKFPKKNVTNKRSYRKRRQQQQQQFHHTQEVKARLATLRTRKVIVADEDNSKQQKGHNERDSKEQKRKIKKGSLERNEVAEETTTSQENSIKGGNNKDTIKGNNTETPSRKRVFPQLFDEATLNRIETLSDNEVKKPTNKRKRNQTAALLLGLNIQTSGRSKRITASASAAVALQVVVCAPATGDNHNNASNHRHYNKQQSGTASTLETTLKAAESRRQQLSGTRDFLKPLPIETVNTNSKKRPRIMSLYERPYQTANDGRGGSVVGNGYMSTSRSSSSGGGGGGGSGVSGGALIISDSNDSQELANQYYLSGTSSAGIAGNSSSSVLLGNGSAINHAPTMGTLCNIGNTCYLNSVVYTLRFAPQFLHNLHHLLADLNALQQNIARARAKSSSLGRGISAVHMENARSWSSKDLASMEQYTSASAVGGVTNNLTSSAVVPCSTSSASQITQKSSHQVLTEKLHDLYQSLYRNEMSESSEPHHADTLLHAIQDVSTIFEGNQQQDAHEFLMCVLNSIRETSQTLLKAIAECPDVILNGYIANPDDNERDLKHSNAIGSGGVSGGNLVGGGCNNITGSNMSVSSALSSLTSNSKSSLFFSRKSKRKDETKNSKNTRLQSPLKESQISGGGGTGTLTTQSNSLFYLNANDLNSSSASTSPPSSGGGGGSGGTITSPSNSSLGTGSGGGGGIGGGIDDVDNSSSLALLLKDKQRLEIKIRELGLDFFNEDFEGITVSTTKCLSCETVTEQKETMIDIAVPVPQAGYESNESTDRPSSFIQNSCITREYFRNENKYRCEQCCGYTEAIRSISYEVLPRLLIIQLSRFSGGMEKINSYIPTSFTLQCFCSKCCELSDANKLHIYKLYSVITHVGATMSVGHYIAYTCSLDWANEYINCPKEQRRRASQERAAAAAAAGSNGGGGGNGTASGQMHGNAGSQTSSSNAFGLGGGNSSTSSSSGTTGFMKIMKFGRNKASSSGDMSKNLKHINGLTSSSKAITNGIGKLTMNNSSASGSGASGSGSTVTTQCSTTCPSINCCAMRLTAQQQLHYLHTSQQTNISDFSDSETPTGYSNSSGYSNANYNNNLPQNPYTTSNVIGGVGGGSSGGAVGGGSTSGYGSTGRGATKASYASQNHNSSEPIWYMCDDDKIKAMTQREFEELLSPARKITITPYLLFYARYNLQTSTPPKSSSAATMSSSSPGPVTSSPQASWSNESLQSSGHSAHSSGMRM